MKHAISLMHRAH